MPSACSACKWQCDAAVERCCSSDSARTSASRGPQRLEAVANKCDSRAWVMQRYRPPAGVNAWRRCTGCSDRAAHALVTCKPIVCIFTPEYQCIDVPDARRGVPCCTHTRFRLASQCRSSRCRTSLEVELGSQLGSWEPHWMHPLQCWWFWSPACLELVTAVGVFTPSN